MATKKEYMKFIREHSNYLEEVEERFINYFKDKSIPLEDRWEIYTEACNAKVFDNCHEWVWYSKVIEKKLKLCYYDDFCIERHQVVDLSSFVNDIEADYDYAIESDDDTEPWTKELIDELKEEVLQFGYSSFVFDW